jgi:hypothetical protein
MNLNKMKLIVSLMAVAIAIAGMLSCESDDPKLDAQAQFIKGLSGTWTVAGGSVTRDGADVTEFFSGMTITFAADRSYTVANAVVPIWAPDGTFTLEKNSNSFNIIRDDGVVITVSQLQANSVTLSFSYMAPLGRAKSISGEFVFNLER